MGLSSKKKTTTKNESTTVAPYAPAIPFLAGPEDPNVLNEARRIYKSGVGQKYYPGSAIANYSAQTEQALRGIEARARAGGSGLIPAATDQLNSTIRGDFLNANPASDAYQSLISGGYSDAAGQADQYLTPFAGGGFAYDDQYLTPFARGDFADIDSNPYATGIADQIAERIQNQVGGIFGAGGRLGSGAHQELLAEQVGDATNALYFDIYNTERGRQLGAANMLAGLGEQRADRQLGAAEYLAGLGEQRADRDLDATRFGASGLDQAYRTARQNQLNAVNNAPALEQAGYYNLDRLAQVGAARDLLNNARAEEKAKRFMFEQAAQQNALDRYANIATNVARLGHQSDSQSKTVEKTSGGLLGSILGAAQAAASIYSGGLSGGFGGGGGGFNPLIPKLSPAAAGAWGTNDKLFSTIDGIWPPR